MANTPTAETRAGWSLVSVPAVYVLLMLAAPLLLVFGLSFVGLQGGAKVALPLQEGQDLQFTLSNYAKLFCLSASESCSSTDVRMAQATTTAMLRSLFVAALVTLTTVVLAYPVAYYVSFHVAPSKKALWLFLITIPFWTSYVIRVALWRTILGYDGAVDATLGAVGIIDQPLNLLQYGTASIIITLSHAYAPFAVLPIFVSLEKVDHSLLEAGQDLGESRWTTFLRVTLPLSMAGVVAAVLIVFIPTVGDYVTPELIGGGKVPMIANFIETQMWKLRNQSMGAALAVSSMLIVGILALIFVLANRRFLGVRK
ncbi:ABC transporter permease [Xinfangfangia sp. CPCC 101601]|uniref:ABC transporter permease n=1 Tax=Pseudogemmobacter lacusdianii TaxID=3069608 RepID=A0ABU0VUZ2_9RHOB|nr:ABC transporter permease [Xinfangfangia sp. CPCC 101601]MDQ2065468.1 ABC transporter permease [Xinfangfangia sp. CPCC 101601]